MTRVDRSHVLPLSVFAGMLMLAANRACADDKVDYNRDIRPLLSNTCYKCHGPDGKERQAGLRLDDRKSATGKLESDAVSNSISIVQTG